MTVQIDIRACRVEEIDTEQAVTLGLSGGAKIRIESRFDLAGADSAHRTIDPEDPGSDRDLQGMLRGQVVEAATADGDTGSLTIVFTGGLCLRVPPDPDFESWSASWPDGSLVVALPGGGLSCWGPRR